MKPKNKYEQVTKTESTSIKELERDFRIFRILTWLVVIIALTTSIACMKLSLENEALKIKNEELRIDNKELCETIKIKEIIILDLEEHMQLPLDVLREDK